MTTDRKPRPPPPPSQAPLSTALKAATTSPRLAPKADPALFRPRKTSNKPAKEELTRAELRKIKENKAIFGEAPSSVKRSSSLKSGNLSLSRSKGNNSGKAEVTKRFTQEGMRALNQDKRDMRSIDEIDRELQEKRRAREKERERLEKARDVNVESLLKKPQRETLSFAKRPTKDLDERGLSRTPDRTIPSTSAQPSSRGVSPLVKETKSLSLKPSSSSLAPPKQSTSKSSSSSSQLAPPLSSAGPSRSRPQPKSSSPALPARKSAPIPSTARPKARSASDSPPPPKRNIKSGFNSGKPVKSSAKKPPRSRDRNISSSELDSDSDDSSGSDRRRSKKRKAGGGGQSSLKSMIWDAMGLDPSKCVLQLLGLASLSVRLTGSSFTLQV